jgi:hypothetical protein
VFPVLPSSGAILCLFDNGITTDNAVGISGGAMAALAMLNGSDIYVGLRQGIVDLVNEGDIHYLFCNNFDNFLTKLMLYRLWVYTIGSQHALHELLLPVYVEF